MSRAAVKAKHKGQTRAQRQDARLLELYAQMWADAALDAVLVRCEGCGLQQVSGSPLEDVTVCPLCATATATFVERLPGHHLA